ncbi:hypothetical protein AB0758_46530 [Tolypothrix bouteillei VB521301_2]|uniref:PAAR motif protein n=1 Tax=Tolypothrix bouteillei VB521301 TaxID=1479485 RepID=A0A0C1NM30_9CYAN
MGKLIIVENDKVEGTDKHNVSGQATNPSAPTIPYVGTGEFDYVGKMTSDLSDFVKINGKQVALKNSKSSLDPGKHLGLMGKNFIPPSPAPLPASLKITDIVGEGKPSTNAGSSFVKVNGVAVLLNNDKIDTCGYNHPGNSTVIAENQDFVRCLA